MWRANNQKTGSNEAPLGAPRRWGGNSESPSSSHGGHGGGGGYGGGGGGGGGYGGGGGGGGGGGPPPIDTYIPTPSTNPDGTRKRKSRWGDESAGGPKVMPTAIKGNVEGKDLENYALLVRIEEINNKLRTGDFVPPERERSPSPPPTYDSRGMRTNTREVRYRKKLEDERVRLVEKAVKNDPNYRPPPEYAINKRMGGKPSEKVYVPVKEFPEIKFFGLLVGPRGNSLKTMERESGAKISIRGRGSVKEGKGRPGEYAAEDDEDMHCLVTADTDEKVQHCVRLINKVIETAASTPEGQNTHKQNQLRDLARLNGTLRDDENQVCQNCGNVGHRKYDCPEQRNFTAGIICRKCGGAGHMARDCMQGRGSASNFGMGGPPGGGAPGGPGATGNAQFDSEYASLMAELGETPAAGGGGGGPGGPGTPNRPSAPGMNGSGTPSGAGGAAPWSGTPGGGVDVNGGGLGAGGEKIPPWRIPTNWHPPQPPSGGGRGGGGGGGGYGGHGGPPGGYGGGGGGGYGGGGGGYGGGQPPLPQAYGGPAQQWGGQPQGGYSYYPAQPVA